jgi:purine nucleosidase
MKTLLLFLSFAVLLPAQRPKPVIFDTDIGDDIDDALALGLALQSPELDGRLVTTVADDVESRTRLAWKELGLFGRRDVALATGAPDPLLDPRRLDKAAQFTILTPADTIPAAAHARAAERIIDTLMRSNEKFTIIPVGPLTNIALALREEPRIKDHIERIVLMGGSYFPAKREYNIYRDRIAAQIVFTSGVPITGVGLDVTTRCKLEGADLAKIREARNPASQFLYQLIALWQKDNPNRFPTLHDPLAVASAVEPGIIETRSGAVTVETATPNLYGATTFTSEDQLPKEAKASTRVAHDVNVRGFLDLFVTRLSAPPRARTK